MNLDRVSLERTFNLGNYESIRVGLEASLVEGENPLNILRNLEDMAELYLQARTQKTEPPKVENATPLKWSLVQTDNPFETNKETENPLWKEMTGKISENRGKPVFEEGYVYWLMRDGFTLARRKK